jgi:Family of unknown function (DUF6263)
MDRVRGMVRGVMALGWVLSALGGQIAFGQTALGWKFAPGQTLHYEVTRQTTNQAGAGSLTTTLVIDVRHKVEAVDSAGTASITQTLDRIRLRMESPQGAGSEYDTSAGQKPEGMAAWMAPMFHAVLNKPVTLKMSRQGKVSDLKLPRGLAERMQKAVGGDQLGNFFAEQGIGQMLGLAALPDQPAMPGSRWSQTAVLANPVLGRQTVETTFDYQGNEARGGQTLAKISSTAQTSFAAGPGQPVHVAVRNEKTQGTLYFDPAAGRLVESSLESRMSLQATFTSKGLDKEMAVTATLAGKSLNQETVLIQRVRLETASPTPATAARP